MDNSTHEEHLCQPLQTKIRQFKVAVMEYLRLEIQITNYISRNQLLMKPVLSKLLYHWVLTKSRV